MNIKIDNENIKIGTISVVPWAHIGLEKWLKNYKIASFFEVGNIKEKSVIKTVVALENLVDKLPVLGRLGVNDIVVNSEFQKLLRDNFAEYSLMTGKFLPIKEVLEENGVKYADFSADNYSKITNKISFRKIFKDKIPLARHKVVSIDELRSAEFFDYLQTELGESLVIQHPKLSGGKGTALVKNIAEMTKFVKDTELMTESEDYLVSSFKDNALDYSVQCVIAKGQLFIGPLQKQILRDPLLCNSRMQNSEKFCGIQVQTEEQSHKYANKIQEIATTIGEELMELGYKGVFGVDLLIDSEDDVCVIEVNPRLTGATPLLTMLNDYSLNIPFMLLNTLEIMDVRYSIEQVNHLPTYYDGSKGATMLVLHSQSNQPTIIQKSLSTGQYSFDLEKLNSSSKFPYNSGNTSFLVQQTFPEGTKIKAGARLLSIFFDRQVLDDRGELDYEIVQVINKIRLRIKLTPVD